MEIAITNVENASIVVIDGDIDSSTAPEVQRQILPIVAENRKIIIDMSKVDFMSSAGLRTMLLIHRNSAAKKCLVILAGVKAQIAGTMKATGFYAFFTIYNNVDEALAATRGEYHDGDRLLSNA
ncbi:MAG: STAS domain-containing protein [Candidatus Schekmanbacteria bacterium]|nr:STAS domain-containing protein [Candidatus Schekmanbacteria bacterium]